MKVSEIFSDCETLQGFQRQCSSGLNADVISDIAKNQTMKLSIDELSTLSKESMNELRRQVEKNVKRMMLEQKLAYLRDGAVFKEPKKGKTSTNTATTFVYVVLRFLLNPSCKNYNYLAVVEFLVLGLVI